MRAIQPADDAVRVAHVAAEPLGDENDQRQHGKGDERQPPVHPQHHAHDAGEREQVAEHGDHTRREEVVQHVDIGRHTRHQPSDRVAVVVFQIEPLQMAVDGHSEIEHDPLSGQLQDPGLGVLRRERRHQDHEIHRGEPAQTGELPGGDMAIDRDLDQVGLRELRQRAGNDGKERDGDVAPGGQR